jgi:hypothetical protein
MTVSERLTQGIAACKAGRKAEARTLLEQVIEQDDHNETAWLWLSGAVETDEDRQICLENVLTINPDNELARRGLQRLAQTAVKPQAPSQPVQPAPPPPQPAVAPEPAYIEPPAAPSPIAAETTVYKATLLSGTQPPPAAGAALQAQAPKEEKKGIPVLWWVLGGIVGVMVVLIACAAFGLALGDQATTAGVPTPTPDHKSAIIGVIRENIAAHNAEDPERYMETIHSRAPGRFATRSMLQQSYDMYDLSTKVYNVKILQLSEKEARASFTLITKKISGPAFRDNRIDGVMILRPDKGEWKLYSQENDKVTYLD